MKKKIKKYISGCIVASLLLTAIPFQVVPGAGVDSKGGKEQEISLDESGSAENTLDGMDDSDDIIVGDVSENNNDIGVPVAESQGTSDDIWGSDDMEVEYKADESSDPENITDEFTDPVFRSAIRSELGLSENAPITKSACADIGYLYLSDEDIKSLEGIKNLTNLQYLYCGDTHLTSLDVSGCTSLVTLNCTRDYNLDPGHLTSLDVSGCTNLSELYCGYNDLTSLDVSGYTNLSRLNCEGNDLTSLDVSGCTNLSELYCGSNQLTSLDVSGCTSLVTLNCTRDYDLNPGSGHLTSLDVSGCTNLSELYCNNNNLTSLDVSGCTNLSELYCGYNDLTSLDVSGCTNLSRLSFEDNDLTSLDVSGTSLEELDVRSYGYVNDSGYGQLTSLNVSGCTNLSSLYCYSNQLTSLDVSGCTSLVTLNCASNDLTSLDVSGCTNLSRLSCVFNPLTSLDTSGCTNLSELHCNNNNLTSLDVSGCTNLSELYCGENNLTSLDVSGCTNLSRLSCEYNQLTSLNIEDCFKIPDSDYAESSFDCTYNNMKTPDDVKGNPRGFDGDRFKFYPQNNGVDAPTTPTSGPTQTPTASPTDIPTHTPTATPTTGPTQGPTAIPTETPTITPTDGPTVTPTATPTTKPTVSPTQRPTIRPTDRPTLTPTPSQKAKKAQRLTVKPSPVTLYIGGASASKTLRVAGAKGKVTYKSSNVRVVKVNTRGKLTPISTGKATVTIKAAGNGSYRAATVKVKITVSDKKVKNAYKSYVKRYLSSKKQFPGGRYELYDINGDSIPEMFFSYLSGSCRTYKIYTYKKGKVIKVGELSGCTDISYNKKKGQICVQSSDDAAQDILTCYEMGTKKLRQVCRYRHISEDINGKTRQRYYKDDKKISKRAYKKFTDAIRRWPVL